MRAAFSPYAWCKLKMRPSAPSPFPGAGCGPVADARVRLRRAQKPASPLSQHPPSFKDVEL